jgi:hypothetical protein
MNAGALTPAVATAYRNVIMPMLNAAKSLAEQTDGLENNPRIAQSTSCTIGLKDGSTVDGAFTTLPGRHAYPDLSSPDCVAAMKAQLDHFDAQCIGAGGLVLVFDAHAEYAISVLSAGSAGAANPYAVMQHLLARLQ